MNSINNDGTAITNSLKARLSFADGLRGFAAFWVVLFHLSEGQHIDHIKNALPSHIFNVVFGYGHLGVAIFFVLSGFVMALTAHKVKFNFTIATKFILRRLTRLAPPYYFAIAFALIFIFIKSKALHIDYQFTSISIITQHLFFVQDYFQTKQINTVFWTLCIEVQFYIVFSMLVWLADYLSTTYDMIHARSIIIIACCSLALLWPLKLISTTFWHGGFIGYWYSFLAGVIVCWGWSNKNILLKVATLYCCLLLIIGLITKDSFILVAGLTASTILLASALNKMHRWLNWPILQWLGLVSYSLYLLHNPITGASIKIAKMAFADGLVSDIFSMCVSIAACLVTACLSYLLVESPCIKWSHLIKLKK